MSYKTRREALAAGRAALTRLSPQFTRDGWKVVAHENIGWHWTLRNGPISVRESFDGTFSVLVSGRVDDDMGGGSMEWHCHKRLRGKTPGLAVKNAALVREVIAATRARHDAILAHLDTLKKS